MGFALPIGDWFRTSLKSMLRDHLFAADSFASKHLNRPAIDRLLHEHDHNTADHGQRLYALLMLELWWRSTRRPAS
jgi:asparagine synthase (glutamine-hydrolysing)